MQEGDYDTWRRYTTAEIEDVGHHELLNWFCLLGAMEALGRTPDKTKFIETYAFVSCVVFAYYHPRWGGAETVSPASSNVQAPFAAPFALTLVVTGCLASLARWLHPQPGITGSVPWIWMRYPDRTLG